MDDDDGPGGGVKDGYNDVAITIASEKMRTGATGRRLFQKVYLVASQRRISCIFVYEL